MTRGRRRSESLACAHGGGRMLPLQLAPLVRLIFERIVRNELRRRQLNVRHGVATVATREPLLDGRSLVRRTRLRDDARFLHQLAGDGAEERTWKLEHGRAGRPASGACSTVVVVVALVACRSPCLLLLFERGDARNHLLEPIRLETFLLFTRVCKLHLQLGAVLDVEHS